jgi:hypothetical protein
MAMSTSSASGITATVADEVWIRPAFSVTGTRWTRWEPPSNRNRRHAVSPFTNAVAWLTPPIGERSYAKISNVQPFRAAQARYISTSSPANKLASSPPSAPRNSSITFFPSSGSGGMSNTFNCSSNASSCDIPSRISASSDDRSSGEADSISSFAASTFPSTDLYVRMHSMSGPICLYLRDASRSLFWSPSTSCEVRLSSNCSKSARMASSLANTMFRLRRAELAGSSGEEFGWLLQHARDPQLHRNDVA